MHLSKPKDIPAYIAIVLQTIILIVSSVFYVTTNDKLLLDYWRVIQQASAICLFADVALYIVIIRLSQQLDVLQKEPRIKPTNNKLRTLKTLIGYASSMIVLLLAFTIFLLWALKVGNPQA